MTYSAIFQGVVSLTVQVAILILIAGWLAQCSRNERVGDRSWKVCHSLILTLTAVTFVLPHFRLYPGFLIETTAARKAALVLTQSVGAGLVWVWAVGFLMGLLGLCLSTWQIQRILKSAEAIPTTEFAKRSLNHQSTLTDGRKITWLKSQAATGPFCWQIHAPIVVLPHFVLEFEDDELAAVMNHEVAHLAAGHPLSLFLQRIVEIIFWFHPLVWWGSWQAARWREFVCDQAAASNADEAAACLRSLLKLAERGVTVTGGMPAGLSFGTGKSLTQDRALRLSEFDMTEPTSLWRRFAAWFLALATVVLFMIQLPLNAEATNRSHWSPWPAWSAKALNAAGVSVRDYEIDSHRLEEDH